MTHKSETKLAGAHPESQMLNEKALDAANKAFVEVYDACNRGKATSRESGTAAAIRAYLSAIHSQEAAAPSEAKVAWPEPKVLNPDIGQETGIPYIDCLLDRLMDAQQDVNLAANEHMDQSLADASSVMEEVETAIRKLSLASPAPVAVTPVGVSDVTIRKAQWAYEREIAKAVDAGLSHEGLSEARFGAIKAALEAASIIPDAKPAVDVVDNLRRVTDILEIWTRDHADECTADIDAAIYCARAALSARTATPKPEGAE